MYYCDLEDNCNEVGLLFRWIPTNLYTRMHVGLIDMFNKRVRDARRSLVAVLLIKYQEKHRRSITNARGNLQNYNIILNSKRTNRGKL